MKLLLVIPVTAIVFLAISAYNEIPEEYSEQQSVPVTNIQTSSVLLSESPSAPKVTDGISSSESQTTTLNSNIVKPSSDQVINSEAPLSRTATMPAIKQSTAEEADTKVSTFPEAPPSGAANSPDKKQSIVQEADTDTQPFVVVEEMPTYPGGDIGLLKYIAENTNYPLSAKQNNLQGKVIVRFCVTTKGGVSQASILKGVSPELDEEALRVVNSLQGFRPGKQGGKVVPVWYMVPITFTLK